MSELNNDTPKKNSTAKKTFMGLTVFIIVCILITGICIYLTIHSRITNTENPLLSSEIINKILPKTIERDEVELTDKAYINGIVEERKKESYGEQVDYYEYNDEAVLKYEIEYPEISGLKDKKVEEKINKVIKDKVEEVNEKRMPELDNTDIERMSIRAIITGNFSDVLSIELEDYVNYADTSENYTYEYKIYGLNFSLVTGEELKFKDLFWEDASIKTILSQAIYKEMAWDFGFDRGFEDDWDWSMDSIDYSKIESRMYNFMDKFNKNPDIDFYFSSSLIFIPYNNEHTYSINMADFYKDIAIYTKYKSDTNIYESDTKPEDFYVFSSFVMDPETFRIESGEKGDNLHYTFYYYSSGELDDNGIKALDAAKEEMLNKIDEYAKTANADNKHGYIIDGMYTGGTEYEGNYGYSLDVQVSRCSKEYYENHLEDALAAGARHERAEMGPNDYEYILPKDFEFYESYSEWVDDYTDESTKDSTTYTLEERNADRETVEIENS